MGKAVANAAATPTGGLAAPPPRPALAELPVGGAMALAGRLQRAAVAVTAPAPDASPRPPAPATSAAAPAGRPTGRTATVPPVQRRGDGALDHRSPAMGLLPPTAPAGAGSTPTASARGPNGKQLDSDGMTRLVDQVVEALEERVLGELERRGGRFLGAF